MKFYVRVLPALLTPIFLTLSFPDYDQGWLIWAALVPLLIVILETRPASSFGLGLIVGMLSLFGLFWWVFNIPGFRYYHAFAAALYLGTYTAVWCAVASVSQRKSAPLVVVLPMTWVSLDYVKSHAGFLSFPWATLAQSQYKNPVILQISSITGEYGVTFLIVMVNVAIALALTRRGYLQQMVAALAVLGIIIFGLIHVDTGVSDNTIKVVSVQPCIQPGEQDTDRGQENTIKRLEELTAKAVSHTSRLELVTWPETAVLNLPSSPDIIRRLKDLSGAYNASILLGASERVKFNTYALPSSSRQGIRSYNAAYMVDAGSGTLKPPYYKNILVPFGEYLPLSEFFQWPAWFVAENYQTVAGNTYTLFTLPGGRTVGVLICWENLFSGLARKEVNAGADILINLVNDVWLGKTGAPRQHNSASILRAIENGVSIIVVSNCGPSLIIDPKGRIMQSSRALTHTAIRGDVPMRRGLTLYSRYGDFFACMCIAGVFLFFIYEAAHSISLKKMVHHGTKNWRNQP